MSVAKEHVQKDYLKEDPPIPGQLYSLVSFVNPRDHVLEKQIHYLNNFLVDDINLKMTAQAQQMAKKLRVMMREKIDTELDRYKNSADEEDRYIGKLLESKFEQMCIDEDDFVEDCRRQYDMDKPEELLDAYKIYLSENRERMNREFDSTHSDVCSLRGFKIRGTYDNTEKARDKAKQLREEVEPGVHVFLVQTGTWFPVDMEADEVEQQDYMLDKLNELMGNYHKNVHAKNVHHRERREEMMQEANEKNSKQKQRDKLRDRLRKKRNLQMKKDMEKIKEAQAPDDSGEK